MTFSNPPTPLKYGKFHIFLKASLKGPKWIEADLIDINDIKYDKYAGTLSEISKVVRIKPFNIIYIFNNICLSWY